MAADDGLATEYENGVADVLGFLAGDDAVLERNVKLPGHRSGTMRQLDVVARGRIFGVADATLVVDCKRWGKAVDVRDIGTFIDLVQDVQADVGLLVTTEGASKAAYRRAREPPGIQLHVMTLSELAQWQPQGTVHTCYRIPVDRRSHAERLLRRSGFRVVLESAFPCGEDEVVLNVFRHYGTTHPSGDVQAQGALRAQEALRVAGIPTPVHVSHGVSIGGGTPGHRWLQVTLGAVPTGWKILAASEEEAARELGHVVEALSQLLGAKVSVDDLDVIRPEGWPSKSFFGN
jgi:hypothetical protein